MTSLIALLFIACESDSGVTTYTTPPNASITNPANGSGFEEGETITFSAAVDDAQDASEALLILWASDIDDSLYEGHLADAGGAVEFVTGNLSAGNHVITLTVIDSDAEKGMDTVEISVSDLPDEDEGPGGHAAGGGMGDY